MNLPIYRLAMAALLGATLWGCQDKPAPEPAVTHPTAEKIFVNGAIYTADPAQSTVSAMAISGDKILFLGDDVAARAWVGDATVVTDLAGKRVLPGLHDAHVHPAGVIKVDDCNLDNRPVNLAELADFVAACVERLGVPEGTWLVVKQWNFAENNRPAGGLNTLREALDRGAPTQLVLLGGSDGHHNATNSLGLAQARNADDEQVGLSAATMATDFSELTAFVGLDANGEPNGEVHEDVPIVLGAGHAMLGDVASLISEAGQIPTRFNSLGITSIFDAAFDPGSSALYDSQLEQGTLSLRVALAQFYNPVVYQVDGDIDLDGIMSQARALREKYRSVDNVKADHLKYLVDGVLEGNPLATPPTLPNAAQLHHFHQPRFALNADQTELLFNGYVDSNSEPCQAVVATGLENLAAADITAFLATNGFHPAQCLNSSGVLFQSAETTRSFIETAQDNDFSVHFHAIGDRAVKTAIDVIAGVTTGEPVTNRHSLAHVQLIQPDDVTRVAKLKIPIAFTYAWAVRDNGYDPSVIPFIDKITSLEDMYNPEHYYMQQAYPAHSIMKAGGVLAGGSDAPVDTDDPRPFHNIEKAVTRDEGDGPLNADEGIAILDAIDAYTIGSARLMQQEDIAGSLEAGKKADFIILEQDPIAMAADGRVDGISETRVLETWFDGKVVYRLP